MKLTLHSFNSDVPQEKICQPGVDYQVYETDVIPEEALTFFDRLIYPRDGFYLTSVALLNVPGGAISLGPFSRMPGQLSWRIFAGSTTSPEVLRSFAPKVALQSCIHEVVNAV